MIFLPFVDFLPVGQLFKRMQMELLLYTIQMKQTMIRNWKHGMKKISFFHFIINVVITVE